MANGSWSMGMIGLELGLMTTIGEFKTLPLLNKLDFALAVSVMKTHYQNGKNARRQKVIRNDICRSCDEEKEIKFMEDILHRIIDTNNGLIFLQ